MFRETSWEQERREVLESIREQLRTASVSALGIDACYYLLDHLARSRRRALQFIEQDG